MSKLHEQFTEVSLDVREAIGMESIDYYTLQYDRGMEFLKAILGIDSMVRVVSDHSIFWSWWKTQWMYQDIAYMDSLYIHVVNDKGEIERIACSPKPYESYHSIELLTTGVAYHTSLLAVRQLVGYILKSRKDGTKKNTSKNN